MALATLAIDDGMENLFSSILYPIARSPAAVTLLFFVLSELFTVYYSFYLSAIVFCLSKKKMVLYVLAL